MPRLRLHSGPAPTGHRPRAGLSLLEVMFSLSLLAVVLSTLVAGMAHIGESQASSIEREEVNNLLRQVGERLQSAPIEDLAVVGSWSEARYIADLPTVRGIPATTLQDAKLLTWRTALADLELFVEYYRGLNKSDDGSHYREDALLDSGLLQWEDETRAEHALRVNRAVLDSPDMVPPLPSAVAGPSAPIERYRLRDNAAVTALGARPVMIRLVVRWSDGNGNDHRFRMEQFLARIADPRSLLAE